MLMRLIKCYGKKLILKELKSSYKFFIKEANTNKNSIGYGLIRDKTILANDVASIASVGYGLGALIIGVEHKWIDYRKAYERIEKTLDTFINYVEGKNGFYYHFVNIQNGKREWNCEISIIDTAIFICGAIGSIVFTPKESISAMEYYYNNYPNLWGKYGFKDGYNLEDVKPWFAKEYIGIDKGIEVIMIENYLNGTIWNYFMRNDYVQKGLKVLGFSKNSKKSEIKM